MGAVLFVRRNENPAIASAQASQRAIAAMAARGLEEKAVIRRAEFEIHVYRKRRFDIDNLVQFDNDDFIVAVGTLIYRGSYGEPALRALFQDFTNRRFKFDDALGHFGVFIYRQGRLSMFSDYSGMYQFYTNADQSLISSSFLALYETLDSYTANVQEIHEYLTLSMFFGRRTLIREIDRVDGQFIHTLLPNSSAERKTIDLPPFDSTIAFDAHVERVHSLLCDYFEKIAGVFGDRISTGLTGGFDSRLMLAYLRHCGVNPRVYVQGADDHIDVRIAKQVASLVGFDIEHSADEAAAEFERHEFVDRLAAGSRYTDGIPHPGLFDKWALVAERRSRSRRPERLRLYGMGGEILRRMQQLPNRLCTPAEFFTVQADKVDTSAYTRSFSKSEMFARMGSKLTEQMQLEGGMITPAQAELAYPRFRLATITGIQMTCENERAHALVPYAEPAIVEAAGVIPLAYREFGAIHSALIEKADPALAAAPTAYGYTPSDGPDLRARLRRRLVRLLPLRLRPVAHRLRKRLKPTPMPYFLRPEYLDVVFPDGQPHVRQWVDLDHVRAPDMMSRALTVELLLSGRLSGPGM